MNLLQQIKNMFSTPTVKRNANADDPEVQEAFQKFKTAKLEKEKEAKERARLEYLAKVDAVPNFPLTTQDRMQDYIKENPGQVIRFFYGCLSQALSRGWEKAHLFRLNESQATASIKKEDYEQTINDLIRQARKTEEYEIIPRLQALLSEHFVNRVIDESKQ